MGAGESRKETCALRRSLASPKSIIKIGTWQNDVQNRENRSCGMGDEELYGIDVLGISECRWSRFGRM